MGYYICRNITKKGNNLIIDIASSNWYPRSFDKVDLSNHYGKEIDKQMFALFIDIMSGGIHLNNSIYNYNYAHYKVLEYLKENNINSYKDMYEKKYDYYNKMILETIGIDLTSDYYMNKELVEKYEKFETDNKELVDKWQYDSQYKVYGSAYDIFKKALEEKEDNTIYTLYSEDYRSFIKCGRNGKFWYGYTQAQEKGRYKEMYCKMKNIGRANVVMQELALTDKDKEQEKENEVKKLIAQAKVQDLEQVKSDLTKFSKGLFDIDRYYLQELLKVYNIKITIPKQLTYLMKNGYGFKGRTTRKTSDTIDRIRKELLEKVGV